ncbi:MAG: CDP-alcohol phosphatidyltransferase family protein [Bryobacteraceae bacterium]|nr:CDP-alcohol phosphatidyltransferase family protein [Bryobacteraceae bacterium]MDW8379321.1 CDP-alcohol phosphatidyltransferase family protein [Bryobacterales bacterium]
MRQLPNLLSLLRFALAPWCAIAIFEAEFPKALTLFFVAGGTDFFDGYLARRFGWHSALGRMLDPLADKALMAMVYFALWMAGAVRGWLVALVFGRDLFILLGALIIALRTGTREFAPSLAGKLSTAFQLGAALFVLCERCGWCSVQVAEAWTWAAAAGTVASGGDYLRLGWRMMRQGAPRS